MKYTETLKYYFVGNLIADAFIHSNIVFGSYIKWSRAAIALINGGSMVDQWWIIGGSMVDQSELLLQKRLVTFEILMTVNLVNLLLSELDRDTCSIIYYTTTHYVFFIHV